MTMSWGLAADVAVIVMLAATIIVVLRFERRLSGARSSLKEFDRLAGTFRDATVRAEESVLRLKDSAVSHHQQHAATESLAADLRDLIERGTTLADRLEVAVRGGHNRPRAAAGSRAPAQKEPSIPSAVPLPPPPKPDIPPRSAAERELLQALRASGLSG